MRQVIATVYSGRSVRVLDTVDVGVSQVGLTHGIHQHAPGA